MFRIFNQYTSAKNLLLMLLESTMIILALLCAVQLRFWNNPEELYTYLVYPEFALQCAVILVVCVTCFYYNDLYDARTGFGSFERLLRIEQSVGAASMVLGTLYFLVPPLLLGRGVFLIAMALVTALAFVNRKILDRAWQLSATMQNVLILGTGQLAMDVARQITLRNDLSIHLHGFVSCAAGEANGTIAGLPVLGAANSLEPITNAKSISRIIVALEDRRGALPARELVTLRVRGVHVEDAVSALSALTGRISLASVRPSWFVFSDGFHRSKMNEVLKRILDMTAGMLGFIVTAPIMALVVLAVRLDSKGPAIYRQTRVGLSGKTFEVLKFRSMRTDAEVSGAKWAIENDPRVTRLGRYLRKYRLDELPQFWNVIRGDMSFVGPRPERPVFVDELRKHIPYYDERHSARPGITGWAQVQYNYGSSVEDAFTKLEYDLFYLKNMSLSFDVAIILKTVRIVLGGHGAR